MSITQRGAIGPILLASTILSELVGCGARVEVGGATDTSTQTSVTSGVSTGAETGVNTGTSTGTGYATGVGTGVNTGVNTVVNFGTGGAHSINVATGGVTHTTIATGGSKAINTGVVTATGTGTTVVSGCYGLTVPPASGTLSVAGGYVTTGSLKGYGFTWAGSLNNSSTCITPTCNTTGCTPAFGSSALCAAGVVGLDTSYNSVVGVGFNLNQDAAGTVNGTVAAPAIITVVSTAYGAGVGNASIRVQISDANAMTTWCVEAGKWTSGVPIPITSFNTACWDNSGTYLSTGAPIQAIHLVVPSEPTQARPFAFCLAGVTFS